MTTSKKFRGIAGAAVLALAATPALATEGYFALGYGPIQSAQGGAGVANGEDAMSTAINPAGVAGVGNELTLGLQAFRPVRGYDATGTGFVNPGHNSSDHAFFPVPNLAYNHVLGNGGVLNFAVYGNGGDNTSYPAGPNPSMAPGCAGGVFCAGQAGVDLTQLMVSLTYAQKIGPISYGIAPTFALQRFSAVGLNYFAGVPGLSANPMAVSNQGFDWSHGFGLRVGIQADVAPGLRFGLSGQTKFAMSKFKKYEGLFADGGDFSIPASVTAGFAWDARKDLTLMMDYQYIWYSSIPSLGNPFPNGMTQLGGPNGPGFGWGDVGVIKLGASWKQNPQMTWRFGYAYSTNPVPSTGVTINILAPGVVRSHFTAGGSYKMDDKNQIDFALQYVPWSSVSGLEVTPAGVNPASNIKLSMEQFAASVGWTHRF